MLTPEDIKSLEAAQGGVEQRDSARLRVSRRLSPEVVASLQLVGLDDREMELCQAWAGLETMAGVSEECRYAKYVLDKMPLPPKPDVLNPGILDKQQFWDQMGLAEHLYFFWSARHFLERPPPKTALGGVALKVIKHWRAFAEENWPTAADLYWALKRKDTQGTKRRRPKLEAEAKVGLASIWRLALHLEHTWHGRGYRSSISPEDIYETLGDLQGQVEVNCWARDDQTMLELLKKHPGGLPGGCSYCDVFSLDTFEFGWGGNSTACPRCSGRLMERLVDKTPEDPQANKWDGGPTSPEQGGFVYRWAIKHGMMWDEFLQKVRGFQTKFDPAKKVLCPLLEHCNTRCAQDQKNGVRGWPLGSSDYETSCYKFREILWCRNTGGTPVQFETVEHARNEGRLKVQKDAERRSRQAKKAAAPLTQEQSLFPEDHQPAPTPVRPVATPTTKRGVRVAPPTPDVETPRMF